MIHVGDCLEVLPTLEEDSVDAIVTDPPYGLSDGHEDSGEILASIFLDVVLPCLDKSVSKTVNNGELFGPLERISETTKKG